MADSPAGRFSVLISRVRMEELERMADAAERAGNLPAFVRWLKELDYRLAHEPHEWGESRETLPVIGVEVRVGTVGTITVWYGVNMEARTVFVKRFRTRGKPA